MSCHGCGLSRRDFVKLATALSTSAGVGLLAGAGCKRESGESAGRSSSATASTQPATNPAGDDKPLRIGYLPITDSAPLLVAHAKKLYDNEGLTVEKPRLFRSWAQISEAFLSRQVDVVHILMPTTIWIRYGQNFPGKVIAWNHTNGSALTVQPEINSPGELGGKTIAVPFWYSVHNVVLQQLLKQHQLKVITKAKDASVGKDEVNLVVLPPSDMVSALANKSIAGYIVAEPFNAVSETLGKGKILRFSGDVWKDHACCVVFMHEDDLSARPQWSQRVVNALVRAQHWMRDNRPEVAQILSKDGGGYTPHALPVLNRALSYYDLDVYAKQGAVIHPEWKINRIDFQPYPFTSYTEQLVAFLKETQLPDGNGFLAGLDASRIARELVDASFVTKALDLVGGPSAFGLDPSLTRKELIVV